MVWPILAGAAAGIAGTFLGSATKKETSIVQHAPYETYAPTDARSFQIQYPDYNVVVNSPLSSAGSKKEMSSQQELRPSIAPQNAPSTTGTDMTTIALIVAAGLIVYGVVSKK